LNLLLFSEKLSDSFLIANADKSKVETLTIAFHGIDAAIVHLLGGLGAAGET